MIEVIIILIVDNYDRETIIEKKKLKPFIYTIYREGYPTSSNSMKIIKIVAIRRKDEVALVIILVLLLKMVL